jgi:hypothetical protein
MDRLSRHVVPLLLIGFAMGVGVASPAWSTGCRPAAIEKLRTLAPDGYAIYQQIKDKQFFLGWITCDDLQLGLSTAVHESVHHITADTDAFPLVNGGAIKRPHQVSKFFRPALIAGKFRPSDFVSTYLRPGQSSSATDFLYLLDELNAYSHDLNAAIDLNGLRPADETVDHRDGLAAAMAFVAVYVETARESQPATWSGLQQPEVEKTISTLWGKAETVMTASCHIPDFGHEDKTFIRRFCDAKSRSALETIIGHAPVCPTECLESVEHTAAD